MTIAPILSDIAAELALFAAAGYLLFAADDLLVDLIYFTRRLWRAATVYSRFPRAFAQRLAPPDEPGWIAIFVPAWDESAVIAPMLRATLARVDARRLPHFRRLLPQRSGDRRGDRVGARRADRSPSRSPSTGRRPRPIASTIFMPR